MTLALEAEVCKQQVYWWNFKPKINQVLTTNNLTKSVERAHKIRL